MSKSVGAKGGVLLTFMQVTCPTQQAHTGDLKVESRSNPSSTSHHCLFLSTGEGCVCVWGEVTFTALSFWNGLYTSLCTLTLDLILIPDELSLALSGPCS